MSSPKPEPKPSVEQQVKAGLRAVKDFLAGRAGDAKPAKTHDKATREAVAAELIGKMSAQAEQTGLSETMTPQGTVNSEPDYASTATQGTVSDEQERARQIYVEHGYFDEVVHTLQTGNAAERAAAARALGVAGNQRGTAHLIAALFDDDAEVRSAAEEAINQIADAKALKVDAEPSLAEQQSETASQVEATMLKVNEEDWHREPAPWEDAIASTKAAMSQQGQHDAGVAVQPTPEVSQATIIPAEPVENSIPGSIPATEESEEELLLQEGRLKEETEQLSQRLMEIQKARLQFEEVVQSRIERDAMLRAEAAARRTEEEKRQREADEQSERQRAEERELLTAEHEARDRADSESRRLADEEARLRLRTVDLRLEIAELVRQRTAGQIARREAAEAAREAELKLARDEAKSRHDAEVTRLRNEEAAFRAAIEEVASHRAEVEAAREQADLEAARLVEAHARMHAAAVAAADAETRRARLESEINRRLETARQQLDETRRRGEEQHEKLEEESRALAAEQQHRHAELELMKAAAETASRELGEKEQEILNHVHRLQLADADARKRIEDADARRRAAEAAYRLVADKVQRVEAEAHARAKEEEQMLARLEAERRSVAVEAQSRTAQEKRIREEIAMFRKLEEQERPHLEAAMLQRSQAEARLQQLRDASKGTATQNPIAEDQLNVAAQHKTAAAAHGASNSWQEGKQREPERALASAAAAQEDIPITSSNFASGGARGVQNTDALDNVDAPSSSSVPPSIVSYLNSVDPYKRAAAIAELARSGSEDAFGIISNCFDDHSPHVRNAAARALRKLEPNRTADLFTRALEEASAERRRNIGGAIAASGVASDAINNLVSDNREETYNALSILFVMAKTGEVEPLERALQEHPDDEIGKAVRKLLSLSGHPTQ